MDHLAENAKKPALSSDSTGEQSEAAIQAVVVAEEELDQDEGDDEIAFAAEAAANAVEEADAEQARLGLVLKTCKVCGEGDSEGRPLLHFPPADPIGDVDIATPLSPTRQSPATQATPSTFSEHICLHVFCGKTASILPSVNKPELEILTKAGIKNKHGIGPDINAALARTRHAAPLSVPAVEGAALSLVKNTSRLDKRFYLVNEFESHLATIRILAGVNSSITDDASVNTHVDHLLATRSRGKKRKGQHRGGAPWQCQAKTLTSTSASMATFDTRLLQTPQIGSLWVGPGQKCGPTGLVYHQAVDSRGLPRHCRSKQVHVKTPATITAANFAQGFSSPSSLMLQGVALMTTPFRGAFRQQNYRLSGQHVGAGRATDEMLFGQRRKEKLEDPESVIGSSRAATEGLPISHEIERSTIGPMAERDSNASMQMERDG